MGDATLAVTEWWSERPTTPPPDVPFPIKDYRLSEFLSTPTLIVVGHSLSRRQLIKYVANKLGGVHYDTSRNRSEDRELEVARQAPRIVEGA